MALVKKTPFIISALVFLVLICGLLYMRPVPSTAGQSVLASPMVLQSVGLPWPKTGQAAMGAVSYGLLDSTPGQSAVPMASIAKVMTALAVLDKKPLSAGQQGPTITFTTTDVATYQSFYGQGQSVVPVVAGEQVSEYKALQAMLIPSANNMAYSLAAWAFGSVDNYLAYANQKASGIGLANTHLADPSGFSPQTTSTANDLVILGETALKNPVLASIFSQTQTDLPIAGTIKNVNFLLGTNGINGIKTGNTDQAGGCFLLSAQRLVQGQPVTTIVAVLGSPDLAGALTSAKNILLASDSDFAKPQIVAANQAAGVYKTAWGVSVDAVPAQTIAPLAWQGVVTKITTSFNNLPAGSPKGTVAGSMVVKNANFSQTSTLFLNQELARPSVWWRIFH